MSQSIGNTENIYIIDGFLFMHQVLGKMPTQPHGVEAELALKPGLVLPDAVPPSFPVNSPYMHPSLTEQPVAQPQGIRSKNVSVQHTHY